MKNSLVSVVIINFNSGKYIKRCIEAVKRQTHDNLEVIVVDNASSDGSGEFLKSLHDKSEIKYIFSEKNLGASGANNLGILKANGEFVLILNADVFLTEDYIEKCLVKFAIDSSIGTVVGKLLSEADHSIVDSAGVEFFKEGVSDEIGIGHPDGEKYSFDRYVAGACCAAALYKREMLESIRFEDEFFDDDFFAFVEDIDLSIIGLLFGWQTYYCSNAIGYHVRGGATSTMSDFVKYLNYRNTNYFWYKTFESGQSSFLYSTLKALRKYTVSKELQKKYQEEFELIRPKLEKKREFIRQRADYSRLKPYMKRSYLVKNLKNRLSRLL